MGPNLISLSQLVPSCFLLGVWVTLSYETQTAEDERLESAEPIRTRPAGPILSTSDLAFLWIRRLVTSSVTIHECEDQSTGSSQAGECWPEAIHSVNVY